MRRERSVTYSFSYMLASRRDAPAGLIQWGDDPSSTRHGLRSLKGFEAHRFWIRCLIAFGSALLAKPMLIMFIVGRSAFLILHQVTDSLGPSLSVAPFEKNQGEEQVRGD